MIKNFDTLTSLFKDSDVQDLILIEEMSELTKELLKRRRGKYNMPNIIEELSHVLISCKSVQNNFLIADEEINKEISIKQLKYDAL